MISITEKRSPTIVPFNTTGDAVGCDTPQSFTIVSATPSLPSCSALTSSINNQSDVPINTTITWEEVDNADGYRIAIRSESNEVILEDEDVGLLTSFTLPEELPYGTTVYVAITPYNGQGDADACVEQSFTTVDEPEDPIAEDETKYGFSPDGDGDNDYLSVFTKKNIKKIADFTIFDRWGNQLYTRQNFPPNQVYLGWDGQFRGKPAPRAVYVYTLTVERQDGILETYTGDFAIVK